MLVKTQGIVVSYLRYKESSIIVKIFTRELGMKSYIVNGVRSAKARTKMGFYQPLTFLDLVVYEKENANLQRISEVQLHKAYRRIPFEFLRSGIALFMAEALAKSVYENYQNQGLFDFLGEAVDRLDQEDAMLGHYPLVFLWKMSGYLGFAPNTPSALFEELQESMTQQMDWQEEIDYLEGIMNASFDFSAKIPSKVRKSLLDHMLMFYAKHLEQTAEWKSIKVLRQMMV